jgi:hypothetical protein
MVSQSDWLPMMMATRDFGFGIAEFGFDFDLFPDFPLRFLAAMFFPIS